MSPSEVLSCLRQFSVVPHHILGLFQALGMPALEIVHPFDPLDFLAELTQHIPPARVQLIRRYGLYSSRSKGHWTRMPYVLQRAPPGWTSQNEQTAATASNRAGSPEVPATETDAPDARVRRHAWARLLARVYEVDPLVCPCCGARLQACRRQAVISSDPESRANQKDPEPSGKNRSGAAGTRSDHPGLNRLLSAESNCRSHCAGGSTQGKVRTPASAAVFIEPHPSPYTRHSHRHAPASALVSAATATRSPSC